jgi:hypothetical protein
MARYWGEGQAQAPRAEPAWPSNQSQGRFITWEVFVIVDDELIGSECESPRRIIRCNACGLTVECTAGDLLQYTREGWPRCCEQVMTFFTETTRPSVGEPPAGQN